MSPSGFASWLGSTRRGRATLVAALLGVAAASWYLLPAPSMSDIPLEVSQLEDLSVLPEFRLVHEEGDLERRDLATHWYFVFFGYTHCPNACPTTLALIAQAQQALREAGDIAPRVLFISVDPRRDTPALVRRYARDFGPDFDGAVLDPGRDAALLHALGVSYHSNEEREGAQYTVDHTTNFYLLAPGVRLRGTFAPAAGDVQAVVSDTRRMLALRRP